MSVKPIPDGFSAVSSYIIVEDPDKAIEFYGKAFGAEPGTIMRMPDGSVLHGEVKIGNSTVMLTAENLEWQMKSAKSLGGSPISMHLYVEDVDTAFQKALDAGCKVAAPLMDAFWGDRYGKVMDPFGIQWGIATHKEDLSEAEMGERAAAWFASMAGGS
jgi:PhnB protein